MVNRHVYDALCQVDETRADVCSADERAEVRLVERPECGLPAEVVWAVTLDSTDGPVLHVKLHCVRRHHWLMAVESDHAGSAGVEDRSGFGAVT